MWSYKWLRYCNFWTILYRRFWLDEKKDDWQSTNEMKPLNTWPYQVKKKVTSSYQKYFCLIFIAS